MTERPLVKFDDKITITNGCRVKSYSADKPRKSYRVQHVELQKVFNPDFASEFPFEEDAYTMPGTHDKAAFRYYADDARGSFKDDFKFYIIPIDLDIHDEEGRDTWKNYKAAKHAIDQMVLMSPFLRENAASICTSRGGIRIYFVLSHKVNALEWVTVRDYVQRVLNKELTCFLKKFKKLRKFCFYAGPTMLVFDPRSVASLTRVPFGFRDGRPVVEEPWFVHRTHMQLRVDIDVHFKRLNESDVIERRGYYAENVISKRPETRAPLPETLKPFRWRDDEPPGSGERDTSLFTVICHAKRKFADRLTPEQYLSYFWDAIGQIHVEPGENWYKIAWSMITRDFLFKSKAKTQEGARYERAQLQHSGNKPFYPATDYDELLQTDEVFSYSNEKMHEMLVEILETPDGVVFLNPPPGAGKSEIAVEFLSHRDGIFISKTNDQLRSISKRLKLNGVPHDVVGSNKWLIDELFTENATLIEIYRHYTENYEKMVNADMYHREWHQKYRNGRFGIKPFARYVKDNHPDLEEEADTLAEEANRVKRKLFAKTGVTLITHSKLLSMLTQRNYMRIERTIIFDEAEPKDVTAPTVYQQEGPVEVYGCLQKPEFMSARDQQQQYMFTELLHMNYSIFINASKGLEEALKHNNYLDIKVLGSDMKAVYDPDLKIVLSPDLRSGYTPYRASHDDQELSPRALYCNEFQRRINTNIYNTIVNGVSRKGGRLSTYNLTNVIGSNELINSKVISVITYPDVAQVAEMVFCTGVTVNSAIRILVENSINQTISRNTGYRCFDSIKKYAELNDRPDKDDKKNNVHICVLPQSMLVVDPELIVRTSEVYTDMSPDVPGEISPFLARITEWIKIKIALYNVEPGSYTTTADVAKEIKLSNKKALPMIRELLQDPETFSDFSLWDVARVEKVRRRNVIRREENIKMSIHRVFKSLVVDGQDQISSNAFIERLKQESSAKHVDSFPIRDLKQQIRAEAFRFEFRHIMFNRRGYFVRTGAELYFPESEVSDKKVVYEDCN